MDKGALLIVKLAKDTLLMAVFFDASRFAPPTSICETVIRSVVSSGRSWSGGINTTRTVLARSRGDGGYRTIRVLILFITVVGRLGCSLRLGPFHILETRSSGNPVISRLHGF